MASKKLPKWPFRVSGWQPTTGGYIVWRDVFEGKMRCTLEQAEQAHRAATFVTHEEARNYAAYRNAMTIKYGTDNVSKIRLKDLQAASLG